jgi:hypothetical protein
MSGVVSNIRTLYWRQLPARAVEAYHECEEKIAEAWTKEGQREENPAILKLMEWMNLSKGTFPGGIPNKPSPLLSMLVSGMAGAGIGYGVGTLGEAVLPKKWKRNRMRRTLALLGGAAGAAPGAAWGGLNLMMGKNLNDGSTFQGKYTPPPIKDYDIPGFTMTPPKGLINPNTGEKFSGDLHDETVQAFEKASLFGSSSGLGFSAIPVDRFNRMIWDDPRVSNPMDIQTQAAASGLITGAAHLSGRRGTKFVTPMDVGRMAAGMGTGFLSGALVGKALGLMMGMPPSTQKLLKNTGMWAGLVTNLVPIAFGA